MMWDDLGTRACSRSTGKKRRVRPRKEKKNPGGKLITKQARQFSGSVPPPPSFFSPHLWVSFAIPLTHSSLPRAIYQTVPFHVHPRISLLSSPDGHIHYASAGYVCGGGGEGGGGLMTEVN